VGNSDNQQRLPKDIVYLGTGLALAEATLPDGTPVSLRREGTLGSKWRAILLIQLESSAAQTLKHFHPDVQFVSEEDGTEIGGISVERDDLAAALESIDLIWHSIPRRKRKAT
jgi:hypothetical protein